MIEGVRFEPVSMLGKGGFGAVYRARMVGQSGFMKPVALKVLHAEKASDGEFTARLRDEARILGLLRHRALVSVDGIVEVGGRTVVVMEYVDGLPLSAVARKCPLPIGPALRITGEVAGVLDAAWNTLGPDGKALHVVHRDIKPGNVMLTAMGEVKVLDFGIARAQFEQREAQTQSLSFGSLDYMAPERLDGIDTPAGDVYALGALLFELIGGRPFGRTYAHGPRHEKQLDEKLGPLSQAMGPQGAPVIALLRQLLAWEPAGRPKPRELERHCDRLVRDWPEPGLRDWADDALVPMMAARRDLPLDDWASSSFSLARAPAAPAAPDDWEVATRISPPEERAQPAPPAMVHSAPLTVAQPARAAAEGTGGAGGLALALGAGGLLGLGAVVLVLAGLALWWWSGRPADVTAQPAPTAPVVDNRKAERKTGAEPKTVEEKTPGQRPTPDKKAAAASKATRATPAPIPEEPTPAPAAAPSPVTETKEATPAPARVRLAQADEVKVELRSTWGRQSLSGAWSELPPGAHELWATFPGEADAVKVRSLNLQPGEARSISCVGQWRTCS
jgi:serine/threonine-protein kinase